MIFPEKTGLSTHYLAAAPAEADSRSLVARRCVLFFRLMAVALGGVHAAAAAVSYSMNADGISYLDIGDAYLRGDWSTAINAVWSPMYSWILGLVMYILQPSMRWEFPLVHIVNFGIYLGALICFEFFWRQLTLYRNSMLRASSAENAISLPEWAWLSLGYLLFIFSSLNLIEMWAVTPDMLMAAFVYLAAGLILRIRLDVSSYRPFILLGAILGLSYLAKAIMFPIGLAFLGVGLISAGNLRRAVPRVLIAGVVFLLFSVPFIAAVSYSKGRLTFGDAGSLTYMKHVNDLPYPHWQGFPPGTGTPVHPSRKVFDTPPIYEFATPIAGTYPISYDPSYWYEGLRLRFDLKQQTGYLLTSGLYYFDLFARQQGGLLFGVVLLYLMSHWQRMRLMEVMSRWGLMVPASAALGFYGIVNVTGRYVGVFVVLFWAELLANVRLANSAGANRFASHVSALMVGFMAMAIIAFNLEGFRDLTGFGRTSPLTTSDQGRRPSWPGEVAQELHRLGIQPGDKVAVIGYGFDSYWARLARVRIVAEMFDWEADPFWLGVPLVHAQVLEAFARTGAKAVIAERVPSYVSPDAWHRVGRSNYYIYVFG